MNQAFQKFVAGILPEEKIYYQEPMSRHTSFRAGGEAACLLQIETEEQLRRLLDYLVKTGWEYFVLGNGSNLLVSDKGYPGVILQLGPGFDKIRAEGERLSVQAGALLSQTAKAALDAGLTGMEFASGIPGSMGGAVVMNAGAYEGEMKQIVESVRVMDKNGEVMELDNSTMEFGYRTSIIKNRPLIVLEAVLKLTKGEPEQIKARMDELAARRREKQPLEYPSAGSTFKRPEGYFAGKLIMDSGLRGYRIGGAQVSEKHCGFVVNVGNATASDIYELIEEVRERVKDKFGVTLEPEVIRLGEF